MSILWKTAFEDPLLKAIQSGHVGNSAQLVDTIVQLYDTAIKQGLINVVGAPPGPVIGNPITLKTSLDLFYKTESAANQTKMVKMYVTFIAGIYVSIKAINTEINAILKNKQLISTQLVQNTRKISQLQSQNTQDSKKEAFKLRTDSAKLYAKQAELTAALQVKKSELTEVIKPRIQDVKNQLSDTAKEMAIPALQTSPLAVIKGIPKFLKANIKDASNKNKQVVNGIKDATKQIRFYSSTLKTLPKMLSSADAIIVNSAITSMVSSVNVETVKKNASAINSIVAKYPNSKISPDVRNSIRNSTNSIIQYKDMINVSKTVTVALILESLKQKNIDILNTFKPKFGPGVSKIEEKRKDSKELKITIDSYKKSVRELTAILLLLVAVKKELSKLDSTALKTYVPNKGLVSSLNSKNAGLGDKYASINDSKQAKLFIVGILGSLEGEKAIAGLKKDVLKQNVTAIKNKILFKKTNPKEVKFNALLRKGIIGYWTGATVPSVSPNIAVVTNPGMMPLKVEMKPTANPANFVQSLSQALQAHLKTVSGTYTIPGSPPVVLPWVGYS